MLLDEIRAPLHPETLVLAHESMKKRASALILCLVLPLLFLFNGAVSEYAVPKQRAPGLMVGAPQDVTGVEGVIRIGRIIASVPHARILFPTALILSVWLLSLVVAYGRARYLERRKRKSEAKLFDELVNRSRVGYLAVTASGKIAATNPALEGMLGAADWAGVDISELGLRTSDLAAGEVTVCRLSGAGGMELPVLIAAVPGDDDTHTQLIVTALPTDASPGTVPRTTGTTTSALMRNLNHELRTPLAIILGSASLLETDVSEDNADLIDAIKVGGERLLNILETLSLLSELESHDISTAAGAVEINGIVARLAADREAFVRSKGIRLTVNGPGEKAHVVAEPRGVRYILAQLLDNAIAHTAVGSVTVSVEHEEGVTRVCVNDTGVGMSPEQVRHVLSDFRDQGHARRSTGGVGLSLARLLAEQMNASLELTSVPRQGTTASATFCTAVATADRRTGRAA